MNAMYSEGIKEQALLKVFNRATRTIQSVADELNISGFTLRNWMKKALPDDKNQVLQKLKRPQD